MSASWQRLPVRADAPAFADEWSCAQCRSHNKRARTIARCTASLAVFALTIGNIDTGRWAAVDTHTRAHKAAPHSREVYQFSAVGSRQTQQCACMCTFILCSCTCALINTSPRESEQVELSLRTYHFRWCGRTQPRAKRAKEQALLLIANKAGSLVPSEY